MNRARSAALLSGVLALLLAAAGGPAAGETAGSAPPMGHLPAAAAAFEDGIVLAGFRAGVSDAQAAAVARQHGATRLEVIGAGTHVFRVGPGNVAAVVAALQRHPAVRYAEPSYLVRASTTVATVAPNDSSYGSLWGLNVIQAGSAWAIATGARDVVVGVVDTGIDYTHPDLAANVWSNPGGIGGCPAGTHGYNAIKKTCDPMDDHNHGTHVAGTIGAVGNNGQGVVGVNWMASIMGLKFLDSTGTGTTRNAIKAIDFAVQANLAGINVRVLNNSWGGGGFSKSLLAEIDKASANGILFVAAAGNSSQNTDTKPQYPAGYGGPNVVAVAATDRTDGLASFSNYGTASVDLGAPGVSILSTVRGGSYAAYSGTSMATSHVSGAAALILSVSPGLTLTQLKATILSSVDPDPALAGKTVTGGRLNVCKGIPTCAGSAS